MVCTASYSMHLVDNNILRAVMFAAFMARLFCSRARHENRRIASYVTVFATPLSDKKARQKTANVAARSIYIRSHFIALLAATEASGESSRETDGSDE